MCEFLPLCVPLLSFFLADISLVQTAVPLDINTATADELKALPGSGDAYSKKIIEQRPYNRKDEQVQKKVIQQATYDEIKDQIVAKQK